MIWSGQAAALAAGAVREAPVVRDQRVMPGQLMTLVLACDHRILYGARACALPQPDQGADRRAALGPARLTEPLSEASRLAYRLAPAIGDDRVLAAIASMPRERFVEDGLRDRAYDNVALPIACGQTISQPLVVGRMLELLELRPQDKVLDVGTGSGYHAALLALLSGEVFTIERHAELADAAQRSVSRARPRQRPLSRRRWLARVARGSPV